MKKCARTMLQLPFGSTVNSGPEVDSVLLSMRSHTCHFILGGTSSRRNTTWTFSGNLGCNHGLVLVTSCRVMASRVLSDVSCSLGLFFHLLLFFTYSAASLYHARPSCLHVGVVALKMRCVVMVLAWSKECSTFHVGSQVDAGTQFSYLRC